MPHFFFLFEIVFVKEVKGILKEFKKIPDIAELKRQVRILFHVPTQINISFHNSSTIPM